MDLANRLVRELGLTEASELVGGHQSRVFRVIDRDGAPAIAKVLEASMVDRALLETRLDLTAALADLDPRVCRPMSIAGNRVADVVWNGRIHCIVCFELATGREPDPADAADAGRMGTALAQLHSSMRRLPPISLPLVAPLRAAPADDRPAGGAHQLLHGDYHAGNLLQADGVMRIFDLDDCGYGPPAFDVANALYMVLFDAFAHGTVETYRTFREAFLAGYAGAAASSLPEDALERFIDLRVEALRAWLDDLDHAPIGIRTASPAWRESLRSFVVASRTTTL